MPLGAHVIRVSDLGFDMKIQISLSTPTTLRAKLKAEGVAPDILTKLEEAVKVGLSVKDASAQAYAGAMELSFDQYGIEGVKHQVMYLLLYLGKWSGDEARACKKVLKKWSSS